MSCDARMRGPPVRRRLARVACQSSARSVEEELLAVQVADRSREAYWITPPNPRPEDVSSLAAFAVGSR